MPRTKKPELRFPIKLTQAQWKLTAEGQMALFILHSIQLSADGKLSNGQKKVIVRWDVDEGHLKPVSFMYEVPS